MWADIKRIAHKSLIAIATMAVIAVVVFAVSRFGPVSDVENPDIIGPHDVVAGDLVVLATESPDGELQPAYAWTVVPDEAQSRVMEKGKQIVLVFSQPGKYTVVLATAAGGGVKQSTHEVTVSGDSPAPQPDPDPEPDPEPEPDLSEWAQWVHDLAVETVPADDRAKQAELVAGQFRTVAAMIAAGAVKTQRDARVELRVANNKALGRDVDGWLKFSKRFADYLAKLSVDGELKTLDQYQKIYLSAADGLDRVAAVKGVEIPIIDILGSGGCANGQCFGGGCANGRCYQYVQ